MKPERSSGYSGCVDWSAGDPARDGSAPPAARKRARKFQIDHASQLPSGLVSQASDIAPVAIANASSRAAIRSAVNGDAALAEPLGEGARSPRISYASQARTATSIMSDSFGTPGTARRQMKNREEVK